MARDTKILDYLSGLTQESFAGKVYRATRYGLDPFAPSTSGGRWMLRNSSAALYTSLKREGALAELSFHLGMLTPLPSKEMVMHSLELETRKTIRITREDFFPLGIEDDKYGDLGYGRTQLVGDAAAFLGCDGLLVPSARWACENLVIFPDNHSIDLPMNLIGSETIEWQQWALENGFVDKDVS